MADSCPDLSRNDVWLADRVLSPRSGRDAAPRRLPLRRRRVRSRGRAGQAGGAGMQLLDLLDDGFLHLIVPASRFRLLRGAESLATYVQHRHGATFVLPALRDQVVLPCRARIGRLQRQCPLPRSRDDRAARRRAVRRAPLGSVGRVAAAPLARGCRLRRAGEAIAAARLRQPRPSRGSSSVSRTHRSASGPVAGEFSPRTLAETAGSCGAARRSRAAHCSGALRRPPPRDDHPARHSGTGNAARRRAPTSMSAPCAACRASVATR
ncbi:MAG: hypothetical protein MZV70_33715 [Desulfobacterales bacterium]|nr:hypothetical protein [Desulfobacterales bacterium]